MPMMSVRLKVAALGVNACRWHQRCPFAPMETSAPSIPRQLARNLCDFGRRRQAVPPRRAAAPSEVLRPLKVLFTHHALGGGDQAGLRISRAEGREALGVRLDPVQIDDGRIVLVGQMAVEP
jgi:hypothetical protein